MTEYVTSGTIGADLTANSATALHALGTRVTSDDGVYIYVKATTAITAGHLVAINSSYGAAPATAALAKLGLIGIGETSLTLNYFGFVKIHGPSSVSCKANVAKGAPLFVYASSAGSVNDVTANGNRLNGILTTATTTSAAATLSCIMQAPHILT